MGSVSVPALPLAVAVLVGVTLARGLEHGTLLWGSLALVVAFLLPRALGLVLAVAAVSWIVARLAMPAYGEAERLDLDRPVSVSGRAPEAWRRSPLGWSRRLRVESVRQGALEVRWPEEVLLFLPPVERPPGARSLRASGRLTLPRRLANGVHRGRPMWRLGVKSERLLASRPRTLVGARPPPRDWPRALTERALVRPRRPLAAAIARALVLGDASALPSDWLISLRRAGLGHLLAVSGLHVGLAISIVWTACLGLRPRQRFLPCGLAVVAYLAVVGPRPSLVRAALMAALAMLSLAGERKPILLNGWSVSIVLMAWVSPAIVEQLSFQLTAAATFGLLTLGPVLRRRLGRWPPVVAAPIAASVAAHIATLPWSLVVFHQWTPGAVLLNLLAVPWTALTLLLSFAVVALGWVQGLGDLLWWLLDQATGPFGWLADLPVRGLVSRTVVIDWPRALVACALMSLAVVWRGVARTSVTTTLAVAVVLIPVAAAPTPALVMLDVGQGEAVLLRDGEAAVLVDGGGGLAPGVAAREVAPALRRLGVDRLTGVILTHPDLDHCAGLLEISLLMPIESLWATPGWKAPCYRRLILRPGIRYRPTWAGDSWTVGRWSFEVMHPSPGERLGGNERSMVVRAEFENLSVLLTGDLGEPGERRLLATRASGLRSTILKLGHHGSRGSTHEAFLRRVRPRMALVSSGLENVYGHPAPEVLRRLSADAVSLWRTDLGGQIVVTRGPLGEWSAAQPWVAMKRFEERPRPGRGDSGLVESADEADRRDRRPDGRRQE